MLYNDSGFMNLISCGRHDIMKKWSDAEIPETAKLYMADGAII